MLFLTILVNHSATYKSNMFSLLKREKVINDLMLVILVTKITY